MRNKIIKELDKINSIENKIEEHPKLINEIYLLIRENKLEEANDNIINYNNILINKEKQLQE